MAFRTLCGAGLAVAVAISGVYAAEAVKSGPQVGSKKISAFNPLHANGPTAGKAVCLV